jgi:hypothetical protein
MNFWEKPGSTADNAAMPRSAGEGVKAPSSKSGTSDTVSGSEGDTGLQAAPLMADIASRPDPDISRLARWRDLLDTEEIAETEYDRLIFRECRFRLHQLGLPVPDHPSAHTLLKILRDVERQSNGYQRHLIGYAAANLDAATWVGQETEEGRLRLATALDYLARAAELGEHHDRTL